MPSILLLQQPHQSQSLLSLYLSLSPSCCRVFDYYLSTGKWQVNIHREKGMGNGIGNGRGREDSPDLRRRRRRRRRDLHALFSLHFPIPAINRMYARLHTHTHTHTCLLPDDLRLRVQCALPVYLCRSVKRMQSKRKDPDAHAHTHTHTHQNTLVARGDTRDGREREKKGEGSVRR